TLSRLVNKVRQRGKKSLAEHIFYGAFDEVKSKAGQDPAKVLDKALGNIMPLLEVRPRRGGGATYQVPIEGRPEGGVVARSALARGLRPAAQRPPEHGGQTGGGDPGCLRRAGRRREEARGHAPHGRGEQGLRALPLVSVDMTATATDEDERWQPR